MSRSGTGAQALAAADALLSPKSLCRRCLGDSCVPWHLAGHGHGEAERRGCLRNVIVTLAALQKTLTGQTFLSPLQCKCFRCPEKSLGFFHPPFAGREGKKKTT